MDRARRAGWIATAIGLLGWFSTVARAEDGPAKSLARYAPARELVVYLGFDGLKAHEAAWKKTALRKALVETKLGELLEDLGRQGLDAMADADPRFRQVRAAMPSLLAHVRDEGLAAALFGTGEDLHFILVGRGAARREVLEHVFPGDAFDRLPRIEKPGRSIAQVAPDVAAWAEGEDLVFADVEGLDRALAVLDGQAPNAADHPVLASLSAAEGDFEPVALGFLDVTALPPLPPDAVKLGLGALKRLDFRWGFQGEALVSVTRAVAPRPRRGLLALFDQPTFAIDSLPPIPAGPGNFAAMSIDLLKTYDDFVQLMRENDPQGDRPAVEFQDDFRARTGLDLRDDVLGQLGPKAAFSLLPVEVPPQLLALDPRLAGFFAYTGLVVSAQASDPKAMGERLEKLVDALNRSMAEQAQGRPRAPRFARVAGPAARYEMDLTGLGLPPFLEQGVSPTIALADGWLVVAATRDGADEALAAAADPARRWKPTEAFVPMAETLPRGMIGLSVSDVRETIPALIESAPQLASMLNAALAERTGRDRPLIEVDPSKVPTADQLRAVLFPASLAVTVDDEALAYHQRESIPSLVSPSSSATLVAILLPAVQAAREAARRAQCTNNLKQIGLAVHNFHEARGSLPADIVGKDGKPLLSWRVAILPYMDEQDLYDEFRLDEPWDSPHNKPLADRMPAFYRCPSRDPGDGNRTPYQGFAGPHAVLEPGRKLRIQEIVDGSSSTIYAVEAAEPAPWTKPADLPFDPAPEPAPGLSGAGSKHPDGFNALFVDGSVRFIKLDTAPAVFRSLITLDQAEPVAPGSF